MMKYISTRGRSKPLNFEETILTGLAPDGGLFVPMRTPRFTPNDLVRLSGLSYQELAVEIMAPFVEGSLTRDELKTLVDKSYASFHHDAIAPLSQLGHNKWLLELYHGPSLAFKDIALQFLGNLLDFFLEKRKENIVVVGATSGDTGSAAIEGCKGVDNIELFIMHPHGRVSEVQRRQMTTILSDNVHNLAVDGNFDDCQNLVKALFADEEFKTTHKLTAVNSINWARIMAQVVYYFYAAFSVGSPAKAVSFSVPTGNFGDIYAGYIAVQMGLPVNKLIAATNKNDILDRFFKTGTYAKSPVVPTISPSMDIQISSNFERLLFDMCQRNGEKVQELMDEFHENGSFSVSQTQLRRMKILFDSEKTDEAETSETIARVFKHSGKLVDTHTAVGIKAGEDLVSKDTPLICLATAHPAKFPDAVKAASGVYPELPEHLADLLEREEQYETLANDLDALKEYVHSKTL